MTTTEPAGASSLTWAAMLNRDVKWKERKVLIDAEEGNESEDLPRKSDRVYIVMEAIDSKGERKEFEWF